MNENTYNQTTNQFMIYRENQLDRVWYCRKQAKRAIRSLVKGAGYTALAVIEGVDLLTQEFDKQFN